MRNKTKTCKACGAKVAANLRYCPPCYEARRRGVRLPTTNEVKSWRK